MKRLLACVVLLALSAPAFAATATLTSVAGNVLVNKGERFEPAQPGLVVQTGDRIMVPADGATTLTFDDGCVLNLQPDTLVTVPATSTCKGGDLATQRVTPGNNTAVGTRPYGEDSWFGWSAIGGIVLITAWRIAESDDDTESP
jgi:hypothetical protein